MMRTAQDATSVRMQPIVANQGWKIGLARRGDLAGNTYENVPVGA
jgi:hypothetical protein